jgi:hypothetical protein
MRGLEEALSIQHSAFSHIGAIEIDVSPGLRIVAGYNNRTMRCLECR